MITGIIPFWLLVLLACCVPIIILGLLVKKMPVIAGLVIAAMVLCILGVALSIGRPGPFATVWPGHVLPHLPVPPVEGRMSNSEFRKGIDSSFAIRNSEFAIVNSSSVSEAPGALSPHVSVEVVELGPVDIRTTPESLTTNLRRSRVRHGPLSIALLLPSLLTALSIGAFLAVGYVFLDAGTRGQFTWPLRIASVVAFAAICVAVAALRSRL